jgi:site-specific DNA-methyltransferase (adenine-specific)
MNALIELTTKENHIVLDPFCGSGTTSVACKNLNRDFIGIELDKEYFKIAEERINEEDL